MITHQHCAPAPALLHIYTHIHTHKRFTQAGCPATMQLTPSSPLQVPLMACVPRCALITCKPKREWVSRASVSCTCSRAAGTCDRNPMGIRHMNKCSHYQARSCSNFNHTYLRSGAASAPRDWSPQTAIARRTLLPHMRPPDAPPAHA